jgi:2-isopropylmalate synthase
MVHLCHATACLWREVVFDLTQQEVEAMAIRSAEQIARRADAMTGAQVRFEYSPETFNVTEPEFALHISNAVASAWDASPDHPVTLNLPTTVEVDSPHVYADQIEWMHRNLDRRDSIILSVHPHNDRGTAVASAELALLAGADRVEGTLFGNGERTGNVCLATLALNLFSQGVDPQLDLSDLDDIRRTVELCNEIPVHPRHPYAGELVFTAFSGTHQDAIAKGLERMTKQSAEAGTAISEQPWRVPYLPIDPMDIGRSYESVVRLNSQSGKGGIAHVLKAAFGLEMPPGMRAEFAKRMQTVADQCGTELTPEQVWETFNGEYVRCDAPTLLFKDFQVVDAGIHVLIVRADGSQSWIHGNGSDPLAALLDALASDGIAARLIDFRRQSLPSRGGLRSVAIANLDLDGDARYGVGIDTDDVSATLGSVASAINRRVR